MSNDEWSDGMRLPGSMGGLNCTVESWDDHVQKSCESTFNWREGELEQFALDAKKELVKYLRNAPKRRAFPTWGICAEVLLFALRPFPTSQR